MEFNGLLPKFIFGKQPVQHNTFKKRPLKSISSLTLDVKRGILQRSRPIKITLLINAEYIP